MHAHDITVNRRTALKYGGLALAGAGSLGGASAASSDGTTTIDPTTPSTVTTANHTREMTDDKEDTYLTEATATATAATNTAEALAAVDYHDGLFGRRAEAATGVRFTVEGDETVTSVLSVLGEYAAEVSASGSAGAGATVSVVVADLTAEETVAELTVDGVHVGAGEDQPAASDSVSNGFSETTTIDLQGGHEYVVELVADSRVSMMGGTSAKADQNAGGWFDFDGGATWDEIEITPA